MSWIELSVAAVVFIRLIIVLKGINDGLDYLDGKIETFDREIKRLDKLCERKEGS